MTPADNRAAVFAEAIKRAGAVIEDRSRAQTLRRAMLKLFLQRLEDRRTATLQ